jgi:hypothetical protein
VTATTTARAVSAHVVVFRQTNARSRALRVMLAALTALLPAAGSELLGNTANLHFYLVYACFCATTSAHAAEKTTAARSSGRIAATAAAARGSGWM